MKYIIHLCRILVGGLFIFSGLIKLNDPVGFGFKLEEYFGVTVLDLPFLIPYALMIAVVLVIFEVLLGVFLLIGYQPKFTIWSLLGMIVFFTFLTFYSAYYNKVTDCGCFGDAIKLTPWESFTKDVILLVLILVLFLGIKEIKPLFNKLMLTVVSLISFIFCLAFVYHVLMHLPVKDFRPYKIGDNIRANMTVPDDAPKAVVDYYWTFNVDGQEQIITTRGSYPNVEGEYISVETKVIEEGYEAPIHDFSIERDGTDYTDEILDEPKVLMVVSYNLSKAEEGGLLKLHPLTTDAAKAGYRVVGMTASGPEEQQRISEEFNLNFEFFFCDETALKTIVRSSPAVLTLDHGTITQKLHWNDFEDLKL